MKSVITFNIALRGVMEMGIVASLVYWGIETGNNIHMKIILGVISPLVIFGIWGLVDFKKHVSHPEWFRLGEELILSFLAAYALYSIDREFLCWILISISIIHHILVYLTGETLLN